MCSFSLVKVIDPKHEQVVSQHTVCLTFLEYVSLDNIVGCFMLKAIYEQISLVLIIVRSEVKVPVEPGTSPKFNNLFFGTLSTFPENFIKVHSELILFRAGRQTRSRK